MRPHERDPNPELTHQRFIESRQNEFSQEAHNSMDGNEQANEKLLTTAQYLIRSGYLPEVAGGLEKRGDATVKRGANGEVEEIVFKATGEGQEPVKIDIKGSRVNGKDQEQLHESSKNEAHRFIDAAVDDPNRPVLSSDRPKQPYLDGPLSAEQRKTLKDVEHALINNDMDTLKRTFQTGSQDPAFWNRISREVQFDTGSSDIHIATEDGKQVLRISSLVGPTVDIPTYGDFHKLGFSYFANTPRVEPSAEDISKGDERMSKAVPDYRLFQLGQEMKRDRDNHPLRVHQTPELKKMELKKVPTVEQLVKARNVWMSVRH